MKLIDIPPVWLAAAIARDVARDTRDRWTGDAGLGGRRRAGG